MTKNERLHEITVAIRWTSNILVEVTSNASAVLQDDVRLGLRKAIEGLREADDALRSGQRAPAEASLKVRPERTWQHYSRGMELIQAIRAMWKVHEKLDDNEQIARNIDALMKQYDLTFHEWYYWSEFTSNNKSA